MKGNSPFVDIVGSVWNVQSTHYATMAVLCALSLGAQTTWRIPSAPLLVRWLPWLGTLLLVASLLVLATHVASRIRGAQAHAPVRWLQFAELAASGLVWLYIAYGGFVFLNGALDGGSEGDRSARVERLSEREIYLGNFISYAWARLGATDGSRSSMTVLLTARERRERWGGEPVRVDLHAGFLRVPWVHRIVRDEEALNRAILARLPDASQPWHQLMRYYVGRRDWEQAQAAAVSYLARYPAGHEDVMQVGRRLYVAHDYRRALMFIEPAFKVNPDYDTTNSYGFLLHKLGRNAEAVELLLASIPLDEKQFWAFYHLGYVYGAMGKRTEAAQAFHEVLARRPDFPEIQAQLQLLER